MIVFLNFLLLVGLYLYVRSVSFEVPSVPENAILLGGGIGGFITVVGESHYQTQLRRAKSCAERVADRDGYHLEFLSQLEPEPTNAFDCNAVRLLFGGQTVGYLTRADAVTFLQTHAEAIASKRPIFARTRIIGGTWEKPTIGLLLDFSLVEERRLKRGLDETPRAPRKKKQSRRKTERKSEEAHQN